MDRAALAPMPTFLRGTFCYMRCPDGFTWCWYPPYVAPKPFVYPTFDPDNRPDPWGDLRRQLS